MTRALVIGGGMGGLTAALAMLQQGIKVEVHEQASVLREVGAGLTMSRSSMRGFHSLGLLDVLRDASQVSGGIPFLHYRTGAVLWGAPGNVAAADDPFVSRHIYRADLQRILAETLERRAPGALKLDRSLIGWERDGEGVVARFADGSRATGDLLIGADGLRSAVRSTHWSDTPPTYTGQVAWRFLVDGADAQGVLGTGPAAVFFGPGCAFNRYLLRHGTLLNCVAIVRTDGWAEEGWSISGDPAELASLFGDWHPDVRNLVALARPERLVKWALGVHPPLPTWVDGPAALLGDAAHPMLPFLGMGAAMAIEDGIGLGRALGRHADPRRALGAYQAARKGRTMAVSAASKRQGELLQAQDPNHFSGIEAPVGDRALFELRPEYRRSGRRHLMPTQTFPPPDRFQDIRDALRAMTAPFDSAYWQRVDHERAYPEAFVDALTKAGWLSALIPAEYGGSGLGLAEASVIMEEINRAGGNAGACHGQMYNMGTLLRHGPTSRSASTCRGSRAASCGSSRWRGPNPPPAPTPRRSGPSPSGRATATSSADRRCGSRGSSIRN